MNKFNILDCLSDLLHTLNRNFHPTETDDPSKFARNWVVTSGFLFIGVFIVNLFFYILNVTGFFGVTVFLGFSWYLTWCITHYRGNEPTRKGDSRNTSMDDNA